MDALQARKKIREELLNLTKELIVITSLYHGMKPVKKENINYSAVRKIFASIADFAHMGIVACDRELKG